MYNDDFDHLCKDAHNLLGKIIKSPNSMVEGLVSDVERICKQLDHAAMKYKPMPDKTEEQDDKRNRDRDDEEDDD